MGIDDIHITHTHLHALTCAHTHTHTHTHTNLITGKLVNPEMSEDLIDFLSNRPGMQLILQSFILIIGLFGYLWLMTFAVYKYMYACMSE